MSASSFTDWQIACDHPGCGKQVWASNVSTFDQTATSLRKALKDCGWTVNVAADPLSGRGRRRLDFCPDHKPEESGR